MHIEDQGAVSLTYKSLGYLYNYDHFFNFLSYFNIYWLERMFMVIRRPILEFLLYLGVLYDHYCNRNELYSAIPVSFCNLLIISWIFSEPVPRGSNKMSSI